MSKVDKNELKIIFQGLKNGDENSVESLYNNYYSTIYGIAFSILKNKDNSEDIVHNVFMKIIKMDKDTLPSQGEASWLYTVTKNEVLQFLRKQKVEVDIDDMYTIEAENSEIDEYIDLSSYHKLLEKLEPLEREIVSLRIISDFTFDKIAQMLDIPLGTVQWKYYKSLHYIKQTITSLATLVVLITTLQIIETKKVETNFSESIKDVEKSDNTSTNSKNSSWSSTTDNYSSEGQLSINFSSISSSSITNGAQDNTGTGATSAGFIHALLVVALILVTVLCAILTMFFLFRKKVKKKKIKKL